MRVDVELVTADFLVTASGKRFDLYTTDEVRAMWSAPTEDIVRIVDWCENLLGKPSGLVGRKGNVCPFVPEAMMRGSLRFAVITLGKRGMAAVDEIEETIIACREHFLAKELLDGRIDIFGSVVMIFPDISKEEAGTVIDPLQRKLKPRFVQEGLMLGEFHPLSAVPGLRNKAFRPLRSPVPLLAVRHMVESDVDFLMAPSDPAFERAKSLRAYLRFLGSSLSGSSRTRAKEGLRLAEAEACQA